MSIITKVIKGGLTANELHLSTARAIFSTEKTPDPAYVPKPIMNIKGCSAKYGGDYVKYYTPLDGCTYINFVPAEYTTPDERICYVRPNITQSAYYVKWHDAEECLEIANIFMKSTRPDKKLNVDIREWEFNSCGRFFLSRVILFPNDGYAYFDDEDLNNGCGKFYNSNFVYQMNHTDRYMVNNSWSNNYLCDGFNKLLKASGKAEDATTYIDCIRAYQYMLERPSTDVKTQKKDMIAGLESKLKLPSAIDSKIATGIIKRVSNSGYSYNDYKTYNHFLFTDEIDKEHVCIRIFEVLGSAEEDKKLLLTVGQSMTYHGPLEEDYRIWITPEGITLQTYYSYYGGWEIKQSIHDMGLGNVKEQTYEEVFNCEMFKKWEKILNNPEYCTKFRIYLLYNMIKYPIMEQLYNEGFGRLAEYIVDNESPNTTFKNLFGVASTSKDLYKHTCFNKAQLEKLINKYMFVKEDNSTKSYRHYSIQNDNKYTIKLNSSWRISLILNEMFKDDIKTIKDDDFDDYVEKAKAITTRESNYWWNAVIPTGYYPYGFERAMELGGGEEEVRKNIKRLFSLERPSFEKIVQIIYEMNHSYAIDIRILVEEKKFDIFNIDKLDENIKTLNALGLSIKL